MKKFVKNSSSARKGGESGRRWATRTWVNMATSELSPHFNRNCTRQASRCGICTCQASGLHCDIENVFNIIYKSQLAAARYLTSPCSVATRKSLQPWWKFRKDKTRCSRAGGSGEPNISVPLNLRLHSVVFPFILWLKRPTIQKSSSRFRRSRGSQKMNIFPNGVFFVL